MTRVLTRAKMARYLRYCEAELAKPDVDVERRQVLEEKARFYGAHLDEHCRRCGRRIEAAESIEAGLGSTCRQHEAVNA